MARLALFGLTLGLFAAACGGIKDYVAQERYLAQKLYDYTYSQPPEEVWAEAMRALGLPESSGAADGDGRVYFRAAAAPVHGQAQTQTQANTGPHPGPRAEGIYVVVRERPGGSWLGIFRVEHGAPEVNERDLHTRQTRSELAVMKVLVPKDADAFERGALVAGRRARER